MSVRKVSRWENMEEAERVLRKVEWSEGCWEWLGSKSGNHGQVYFGGRATPAYRAVWMLMVGEIPDGLTLDHLCRNPGCVNPEHLEPCTLKDNVRRHFRRPDKFDHASDGCEVCQSLLASR